MYSKIAFVAATALLSLAPTVLADGSANIKNQCKQTVYVESVADKGSKVHELHTGDTYNENFRSSGNGGGVSMKMSLEKGSKDVSQFEYTVKGDQVFYDLSNVNGYPFSDGGISLEPSEKGCTPVTCSAGEPKCQEAYSQPYDDHATHGCKVTTDLNMILCAGNKSSKRNVSHPHYPYYPEN